jgi:hypothetical protein
MKIIKKTVLVITLLAFQFLVSTPVLAGEIFDEIVGEYQGTRNNLQFSYAYKGDIFFGGNTGCQYGLWSHCGLSADNRWQGYYSYDYDDGNYAEFIYGTDYTGFTIESTPTTDENDVIGRYMQRFWFYDWAAIGWVENELDNAHAAADEADTYSGPYDWTPRPFWDNDSWHSRN